MNTLDSDHYLLSVKLLRDKVQDFNQYPFSLDVIRQLDNIEFHPKVTFIIGENGTGKKVALKIFGSPLAHHTPSSSNISDWLKISADLKMDIFYEPKVILM